LDRDGGERDRFKKKKKKKKKAGSVKIQVEEEGCWKKKKKKSRRRRRRATWRMKGERSIGVKGQKAETGNLERAKWKVWKELRIFALATVQ
jgi:hypothetical protein